MKKTLIRNARVAGTKVDRREPLDVLIVDGTVAEISRAIECTDARELNAGGALLVPGLVDMHVHLREPGREDEETIESGAAAAAHGGVTTVAAMPNTEPTIDSVSWVEFVKSARAVVNVLPIAALTKGRKGSELTEMAELAEAGAVAFSDDGSYVVSANVMRRGLQYARMTGRPVIAHCEDPDLTGHGVMNEGLASTIAGLRPAPAAAEEVAVARDVILARTTGARLHVAHVSTAGAVEIIRRAKADGANVTCETCPHYFTLTDDDVRSYDTSLRVNPPLRTSEDVEAVRAGLADGTIDAIASDHAPHSLEEKQVEFDAAPPGMVGLETLLPLTLTHLVGPGVISVERAVELTSAAPAAILGVSGGRIEVGTPADLTLVDTESVWTPTAEWLVSKCKNSPFLGRELRGRAVVTLCGGDVVFEEPEWKDSLRGDAVRVSSSERGHAAVRA